MAKGRKRKNGKRTSSGRLSRAGKPTVKVNGVRRDADTRNSPSLWVAGQLETFGNHYGSALGRAYAKGLLADPKDEHRAKERLDAANKLVSLYRRVFGGDAYRCALNDAPRGFDVDTPFTERDAAAHEWLLVNIGRIDATGCRPFFDQLVSRLHCDTGPVWLDRLLTAKGEDRRDRMVLDAAIKAIDAIGPVETRQVRYRDEAA